MKVLVRPELPTASVGSSQATTAAVDNSAPLLNRLEPTYKSGKTVQTNGATSLRGIDVSKDFANLRRATDSDLDLTQAASRAIVSGDPIAADGPPAALGEYQSEIGNSAAGIHIAYSPNVPTSTTNTAIKSPSLVGSIIDSLKDAEQDMHGGVDQV